MPRSELGVAGISGSTVCPAPPLHQSCVPCVPRVLFILAMAIVYDQQYISQLCTHFIANLFANAGNPPSTDSQLHLINFIFPVLRHANLHPSTAFAALVLLSCLKIRFPAIPYSAGHRAFFIAYMIASKVLHDNAYTNLSWCTIANGVFTLHEINEMECNMCSALDWDVNVDSGTFAQIASTIGWDFGAVEE